MKNGRRIFGLITLLSSLAVSCEKTTSAPAITGVASLTVVNAIPNSTNLVPVIGSTQALAWFASAQYIPFSGFFQYSVGPGSDTVYVVQQNADTLEIGAKVNADMFYGILSLSKNQIYSLYLCGKDTSSPDYLFTVDTLPYHSPSDSTVGIRFVNLSAGSNPVSINLEGSQNGSEVSSLSYKSITRFKSYNSNSLLTSGADTFVIRDAITGDSLTSFTIYGMSAGSGEGLADPITGNPIVFKNGTLAIIGQPGPNAAVSMIATWVADY